MSYTDYTEIPTGLLERVAEVVDWIAEQATKQGVLSDDGYLQDDTGSAQVKFRAKDLKQMMPLIKWLQYIETVWVVEDENY